MTTTKMPNLLAQICLRVWVTILGMGGWAGLLGGLIIGVSKKKKSPDFRSPEVGISVTVQPLFFYLCKDHYLGAFVLQCFRYPGAGYAVMQRDKPPAQAAWNEDDFPAGNCSA